MSCADLNEVANVFTAIGTLAMALMAGAALHAWKKEFIGKRKIELAAEIMEAVCDVQDSIVYARLALVPVGELEEIRQWLLVEKSKFPDKIDIYDERLAYLAANHRLNKCTDKIEKLNALVNKGFMYWGTDLMQKLKELHACIVDVKNASKWTYYDEMKDISDQSWRILYSNGNGTDEFSTKVNNIVEEIRSNLEPLYKGKQVKWKHSNKKS